MLFFHSQLGEFGDIGFRGTLTEDFMWHRFTLFECEYLLGKNLTLQSKMRQLYSIGACLPTGN
jgi:hypothetical protein